MAVQLHSDAEIQRIDASARIARAAQTESGRLVEQGADFVDIDQQIATFTRDHGARPVYAGHKGFPNRSAVFASNEQLCNVVVSPRHAVDGDILGLSIAVELDGMHAKSEETYQIGQTSPAAERLVDTAYAALERALEVTRPGKRIGDIGAAIQHEAVRNGFCVIETFCGHGIGAALHIQPHVECVGRSGTGMKLKEGMVLYIMAMLAEHSPELVILDDGWTAVTRDRGLCATAARMVAIGAKGTTLLPEGLGSDSPLVRPRLTAPNLRPSDAETAEEPRTRPWYARLFSRS